MSSAPEFIAKRGGGDGLQACRRGETLAGMKKTVSVRALSRGIAASCLIAAWVATSAVPGARSSAADQPLPTGVVLPEVPEKANPSQTFALYLPSSYTATQRWPVIFAFDWAGRGKVPAELFYPAAAKRGYIVVGSNSSRNGSPKEALEAALALWTDARSRFSIDEHQVYVAGFSGAARSAFAFADQCDCVQGVIAAGAGLPHPGSPPRGLAYGVFMTLGDYDHNYSELVALAQELDARQVPNRLVRFDGGHQWPPAEVLAEAVDWLGLEAMRQGRRPKDTPTIAEMRGAALARARADDKAGDVLSAYQEYRKSAQEFAGLADAAEFAARAAALSGSPELLKAEKQQREDIAMQKRMVDEIEQKLSALPAGTFELQRRLEEITSDVAVVRHQANRSGDPRTERVARRAVSDLFATCYDTGLSRFRQGDAQGAEAYYQVAATAVPDSPAPQFELARIYASSGDKKRALRALELAVEKGLSNSSSLKDVPEFASLRGEPRFQELITRMERGH